MSFSDRDGFIWMDGVEVPWREANIHILTHSLHYGVAAFEGMRAYETRNGTAIFRLKDQVACYSRYDRSYEDSEFATIDQVCLGEC